MTKSTAKIANVYFVLPYRAPPSAIITCPKHHKISKIGLNHHRRVNVSEGETCLITTHSHDYRRYKGILLRFMTFFYVWLRGGDT